MLGNKYLLDTNVVIDILSGSSLVTERLGRLPNFSLCTTVLGELYVGIYRVNNKIKHENKLLDFLVHCERIISDTATSQKFGEISALLYKKGRPIPSNDIWIAAIALQHNLTLITQDKHFAEIDQLKVEKW